MTDRLVVVANEPVHPPLSGGTVRTAAIAEHLADHFSVALVVPAAGHDVPADIDQVVRPPRRPSKLSSLVSTAPLLGWRSTGRIAPSEVPSGDALFVSHSYLVPMLSGSIGRPLIVDFQNLEVERQASMGGGSIVERAVAVIEALKARRWEPAVARRADLCVAVSDRDAETLRGWGGEVVVVPNASHPVDSRPSPGTGPVGVLANASYPPNRDGLRWLLGEVWPAVIAARPDARLVVAGRHTTEAGLRPSTGVQIVGAVESVADFYASCAVVAAPVGRGGGSQLKVIEALANGRCVVATDYSAASVPTEAAPAVDVAANARAFAAQLVVVLDDPNRRHAREAALRAGQPLTWERACEPLVERVTQLVSPAG